MVNLTSDVLNAVQSGKSRAAEIADFTFGNINSVRSALSRLKKRGDIVQVSRGFYKPAPSFFIRESIQGWYMSGLKYGRNVGVIIYGVSEDRAENVLRNYLINNVTGYNEDFYGLGTIDYDGFSPIKEIIEVNL